METARRVVDKALTAQSILICTYHRGPTQTTRDSACPTTHRLLLHSSTWRYGRTQQKIAKSTELLCEIRNRR